MNSFGHARINLALYPHQARTHLISQRLLRQVKQSCTCEVHQETKPSADASCNSSTLKCRDVYQAAKNFVSECCWPICWRANVWANRNSTYHLYTGQALFIRQHVIGWFPWELTNRSKKWKVVFVFNFIWLRMMCRCLGRFKVQFIVFIWVTLHLSDANIIYSCIQRSKSLWNCQFKR